MKMKKLKKGGRGLYYNIPIKQITGAKSQKIRGGREKE